MDGAAVIELPIRIESVANLREHWRDRSSRTRLHRAAAVAIPRTMLVLPCTVTLTRIAARKLDDDNLRTAFKALRDGVADRLGCKDNDPRIRWLYAQQRGLPKQFACRISIEAWGDSNAPHATDVPN
jgi:hypothetical protein